jgi:hypothetical protein
VGSQHQPGNEWHATARGKSQAFFIFVRVKLFATILHYLNKEKTMRRFRQDQIPQLV